MPVTKQYLRYSPTGVFGVVTSSKSNLVILNKHGQKGSYVAVGACERVIVWDTRTEDKVQELVSESSSEVTVIAKTEDQQHIAAGYENGDIVVFDIASSAVLVTFRGHKSAVTALCFDPSGTKLASGSKDTNLIVWDLVNESGLFRLKGHKGMITKVYFCRRQNVIISSSKDTFVKFWDLDTQHCFKTLVGHKSEVWAFVVIKDDTELISGTSESQLHIWKITWNTQSEEPKAKKALVDSEDGELDTDDTLLSCTLRGSLTCRIKNRVVSISVDQSERVLGVHGTDSYLDLFYIASEEDLTKKLKKRKKKLLKRTVEAVESDITTLTLEDEYMKMGRVKFSGKLANFETIIQTDNTAKVFSLLSNNSLEISTFHTKKPNKEQLDASMTRPQLPGHVTDVRTVAFSSDNTCCLSGSAELLRIWNRASQQCIRSMSCNYALCSLFTHGDRHIVIGTKTGKLQIFDIASGSLLEDIEAHEGAVWSICLTPTKRGLISGGADHEVKFWEFQLKKDEQLSTSVLSLSHKKTLKMADDVLSVKITADHRLLCVSLLDNTVKVFFVDTLKFFLSLYGHKLPVLCMDTSDDNTLLASGSADRNIKLWGLDFGDCHKSLFAHEDSVMCLKFVPKTHMFFSGGKDSFIKLWDGDTFQMISKIQGHHAEVWCLAISPNGKHVLTGSHDKSIRLWSKTSEPLILEEEKEIEREKQYEKEDQHDDVVIPGETNTETGLAARKTPETLIATDKIIDALDVYRDEMEKSKQYEADSKATGKMLPMAVNPLLQAYKAATPSQYVFEIFKRVKASEMEKALLMLPFEYACDLLKLLNDWVKLGWQLDNCLKCLLFLLRIYHGQITMNKDLLSLINDVRSNAISKIRERKEIIGFNNGALAFLRQALEERKEAVFFSDATSNFKLKKKKRQKKHAAILTT